MKLPVLCERSPGNFSGSYQLMHHLVWFVFVHTGGWGSDSLWQTRAYTGEEWAHMECRWMEESVWARPAGGFRAN